jgi:hypothetical protein
MFIVQAVRGYGVLWPQQRVVVQAVCGYCVLTRVHTGALSLFCIAQGFFSFAPECVLQATLSLLDLRNMPTIKTFSGEEVEFVEVSIKEITHKF